MQNRAPKSFEHFRLLRIEFLSYSVGQHHSVFRVGTVHTIYQTYRDSWYQVALKHTAYFSQHRRIIYLQECGKLKLSPQEVKGKKRNLARDDRSPPQAEEGKEVLIRKQSLSALTFPSLRAR